MRRPALALVGPTCTGKTRTAVSVAHRLAPAELISADSRQLLRGLHAGTCAPTPDELRDVPCHLLDLAAPGDDFSVHEWLLAARAAISELDSRDSLPIIVGGTGLYVRALVGGFDLGSAPPDRERRGQREAAISAGGLLSLVEQLKALDPAAAARTDPQNPRRVVRALEIAEARQGHTGKSPNGDASGAVASGRNPREAHFTPTSNALPTVMIGLDVSASTHRRWVEARARRMFDSGAIVEEAAAGLKLGITPATLAASGIGYAEALDVLARRIDAAKAIALTVQRTLRYAKAQRTWWRADGRLRWLRVDEYEFTQLVEAVETVYRHAAAAA